MINLSSANKNLSEKVLNAFSGVLKKGERK